MNILWCKVRCLRVKVDKSLIVLLRLFFHNLIQTKTYLGRGNLNWEATSISLAREHVGGHIFIANWCRWAQLFIGHTIPGQVDLDYVRKGAEHPREHYGPWSLLLFIPPILAWVPAFTSLSDGLDVQAKLRSFFPSLVFLSVIITGTLKAN